MEKNNEPYIDKEGNFIFDTVENGVWYVLRPKMGVGARALPTAVKLVNTFNTAEKTAQRCANDLMTAYTPKYKQKISVGVYREKYVFTDMLFVHTTADTMKKFMATNPYQLFYINDRSKNSDTNKDEYGQLTNDTYMRVRNNALRDLYLSLEAYKEDIRFFTAEELSNLKYTRNVLIVDGPLQGRTCRIKSIEGKKRVIVELFDGNFGLVLLMPDTHFQKC